RARPVRAADPDHELAAAAEICRRLDGLPLAIELAAAWTHTLAVADLLALVVDRGAVADPTGRAGRFDGLDDVLQATWAQLAPSERRLLTQLTLVTGEFGLDEVSALGGASAIEDLAGLRRRSLVQVSTDSGRTRVRVLALTRAFATRHLAPADRVT